MKKSIFHHICCLTVLLSFSSGIWAQEEKKYDNNLSIDASLMSRGETRKGGLPTLENNTKDEAHFIIGRTRLSIDYKRKGLETKATAQNLGVWGQKGSGSFNLYEAWGKITAKNGLFAQIGRQELNYDDERILGRDDWAMTAPSHDVLKVGYEGHNHKLHLILAYNQQIDNINGGTRYTTQDGTQPYKTMNTAWYHYDVSAFPLGVSLLFMNVGMQNPDETDPKMEFQQLVGSYLSFKPEKWSIEGAYYRQMGKDEYHIPIEAWMTSLKISFSPTKNYKFYAGYDYLSGDDNPVVPKVGTIGMALHDKVKGFSTVYGSHHQFYGAMDFFYVSGFYGGYTPGLQNVFAGGTFSPLNGLSLTATYHYMATANKISDAKKSLGHEIELSASYDLTKDVQLSLGYSFMDGTSTLERLQRIEGKDHLRWGWLMIIFKPNIFTTGW